MNNMQKLATNANIPNVHAKAGEGGNGSSAILLPDILMPEDKC